MDDIIIDLETHLQAFIQECKFLRYSNSKLQQAHAQTLKDNQKLLSKHKSAVSRVESMVSRLKLLGKSQ